MSDRDLYNDIQTPEMSTLAMESGGSDNVAYDPDKSVRKGVAESHSGSSTGIRMALFSPESEQHNLGVESYPSLSLQEESCNISDVSTAGSSGGKQSDLSPHALDDDGSSSESESDEERLELSMWLP